MNTDPGARHQIFSLTIEVSHHALHVAGYDFRNSVTAANEALDVYYACTNCDGNAYPTFSHETRDRRLAQPTATACCSAAERPPSMAIFRNELDAYWDGANHHVHVAWADNRDVSPCDLDPAAGLRRTNTGNRNQNIYADHLTVAPQNDGRGGRGETVSCGRSPQRYLPRESRFAPGDRTRRQHGGRSQPSSHARSQECRSGGVRAIV